MSLENIEFKLKKIIEIIKLHKNKMENIWINNGDIMQPMQIQAGCICSCFESIIE